MSENVELIEQIVKTGKCPASTIKKVKTQCKRSQATSLMIIKQIIDGLKKTTKIETKLILFELLDILFVRSNAIRTHVLDHFDPISHATLLTKDGTAVGRQELIKFIKTR